MRVVLGMLEKNGRFAEELIIAELENLEEDLFLDENKL